MNFRNKRFVLAAFFAAVLAAVLLCGCGRKGVEILPEGTVTEAQAEASDGQGKATVENVSDEKEDSAASSEEEQKSGSNGTDMLSENSPASGAEDTAAELAASSEPAQIYVDVCGAVTNPGVYGMSPDSRVFQAIAAAGGLSEDASAASVNQAQPLSDGQQVYVPTITEVEQGTAPAPGSNASAVLSGAGTSAGSSIDSSGGGIVPSSGNGRVNINTADAETLKTLSGIGDSKAAAIISYREENGGFQTVEDIMQVSGIGEATFSKLKDKITVTN